MEIIGKIIEALPEASGVSQQSGRAWKKREYVLETQDTYPRRIFFSFFNDRADMYPLQVGQVVRLTFDIDSRKYQERWYVQVNGLKAEDASAAAQPYAPAQPQAPYTAPAPAPYAAPAQPNNYAAQSGAVPPPPMPAQEPSDDLPF